MTRLLCVGIMYIYMSIPWMVEVLEVRESLKKFALCIGNVLFCGSSSDDHPASTVLWRVFLDVGMHFTTLLCIARHSSCPVLLAG